MKKKLKLLLCGLLLTVSLAGCGSDSSSNYREYELIGGREFLVIRTGTLGDVHYLYVDTETKVQYLIFKGGHYGSMSVLLDADGKPILYKGEV